MPAELLPMFPLELVLLPEELLPLHIFEERYKLMIGECLAAKSRQGPGQEFGLIQAKGEGIHPVGCAARILNVTRRYPDGRMDILALGDRRFEVLYTDQEKAYLRCGVLFFEDESGADVAGESEAARAIEMFERLLRRLRNAAEMPVHLPRPYRYLSFRMAASLPLELDFKQQLLSVRAEPERLEQMIGLMEFLLEKLDQSERAQKKAGGNGDIPHKLS
jgi:Lon protease-like protein